MLQPALISISMTIRWLLLLSTMNQSPSRLLPTTTYIEMAEAEKYLEGARDLSH